MSVEQVARDFVIDMLTDPEHAKGTFTANAMASGGILPQAIPLGEAMKMTDMLRTAFPDLHIDIQRVKVDGNRATVDVVWGGTQTGPLNLPMPGMPAVPPSGKKVSAKDEYVVTVQGDKVSDFHVESPADGGIPAALSQMGIKMPGM